MQKTQKTALAATFAALHVILFLPEGPWRSFVIYLMPIEGIILGPTIGFTAALLGSTIARIVKPSIFWMFGIVAEPVGVATAGFLAKGHWKEPMLIYSVMLTAYFAHPYGRILPLWTILDVLTALILIYPASKVGRWLWEKPSWRLPATLLAIAFVSIAADSMTRVFLLVPMGFSNFFGWSYDILAYEIFIPSAIASYIEDSLVCIATLAVGTPLLTSLKKILNLNKPLS